MEIKFITFVLSLTLAQSCSVLSLTATYGLPEEVLADLSNITANENAVVSEGFESLNALFDILENLAAQSIFDLTAGTENGSSGLVKGVTKGKNGTDYILNSIPIALGESCSIIETSRTAIHNILGEVYVQILNATALAESASYSESQAEIEVLRTVAQEGGANFVRKIYDSIRICTDSTTDNATLAVIENAQDASGNGVVQTLNAIFNAIKIYGAAVSTGKPDINLLIDIEYVRDEALIGLKRHFENFFSTLKAILINDHLGETGIVSDLAADQHARIVVIDKIQKGAELIYDTIINNLKSLELGLSPHIEEDFSRTDAARAEAAARFNAANSVMLLSLSPLKSIPDSAIEAASDELSIMMNLLVSENYDAIDMSMAQGTNYFETQSEIEVRLENILSHMENYVGLIFNTAGNDQSWDVDTETKIAAQQDAAEVSVEIFIKSILNATETLLKASHSIGTSSEDYLSAILAKKSETISAIISFADAVSSAHIIAVMADN